MQDLVNTAISLDRLATRLAFHEYDITTTPNDISMFVSDTPIIFSIRPDDYLLVSTTLTTRLPQKKYDHLAAVCTVLNTDQFFPKVFPISTDSGWTARVEVPLDCAAGLNDQQLDDHLGLAISAILTVLTQAKELLN